MTRLIRRPEKMATGKVSLLESLAPVNTAVLAPSPTTRPPAGGPDAAERLRVEQLCAGPASSSLMIGGEAGRGVEGSAPCVWIPTAPFLPNCPGPTLG